MYLKDSQPSRFMFWCTSPFLLTTFVLLAILVRPPETAGWIVLGIVELLCVLVLLGLWNSDRFRWCWRAVGAIVFGGYFAYLVSMIFAGQWFGDGRRTSQTAFNALCGLIVFGYPGFMYAVFGRLTWRREPDIPGYTDEFSDLDESCD